MADGGTFVVVVVVAVLVLVEVSQDEHNLTDVVLGHAGRLANRNQVAFFILVYDDDGQRVISAAARELVGGLESLNLAKVDRSVPVHVGRAVERVQDETVDVRLSGIGRIQVLAQVSAGNCLKEAVLQPRIVRFVWSDRSGIEDD